MQKIITSLIKLKDYWQIPSNLTTATFEGISKRIPSLFPSLRGLILLSDLQLTTVTAGRLRRCTP
jgi:hypothetical protein